MREREMERDAPKHGAVVKLIFGLMLMHSLIGLERRAGGAHGAI